MREHEVEWGCFGLAAGIAILLPVLAIMLALWVLIAVVFLVWEGANVVAGNRLGRPPWGDLLPDWGA